MPHYTRCRLFKNTQFQMRGYGKDLEDTDKTTIQ